MVVVPEKRYKIEFPGVEKVCEDPPQHRAEIIGISCNRTCISS